MGDNKLSSHTVEQFITFRDETIKLCRSKGKISQVAELVLEDSEEVIEVGCLKEVPDVSFFTLGHVYVTARVPYSLLDQYRGETQDLPEARDASFLTFETPLFADGLDVVDEGSTLGTWGNKIHAVDDEHLDQVTSFFTGQVLKRGNRLYGITYQDAMLQDPVLRDKHGVRDENLIHVRLFMPFTNRGYLSPYIDFRTGQLQYTVRPSSPEMKRQLRATARAYAEHNK